MRSAKQKRSQQDFQSSKRPKRYTATLERSHPLDIKPIGNLFLSNERIINIRDIGLGDLGVLDDEIVISIFANLDAHTLARCGTVSKAFYVFSQLEELWKNICLDAFEGNFVFCETWKATFVQQCKNKLEPVSCGVGIKNFYSDALFNRWYCSNVNLEGWVLEDNIDRRANLSVEEFNLHYGIPNKPVIVTDIVPKWPAFDKWTKEKLIDSFGDVVFKTDQGVPMTLKNYFTYAEQIKEHNPMYLFDNDFVEKSSLKQDYEIPKYFGEDFFENLPEEHRPSFRWILIGPPRSGSSFHKDPNATSAWNGVISGLKKWILYPPDIVPPGVHPSADGWTVETPESVIEWFIDFYQQTKKSSVKPVECLQRPGELIFIPSTWWHCALNIELTIAVTQNVVNSHNLANVYSFLKAKSNPTLFQEFVKALEIHAPTVLHTTENKIEESKKKKKSLWDQLTSAK
mmetsp:Transcript_9052/g.12445  ORF Transcript_9052/g.12445 Transcript_9052/m.12445 type:complete len:457 (-) Transcript_9052:23-1393(-)